MCAKAVLRSVPGGIWHRTRHIQSSSWTSTTSSGSEDGCLQYSASGKGMAQSCKSRALRSRRKSRSSKNPASQGLQDSRAAHEAEAAAARPSQRCIPDALADHKLSTAAAPPCKPLPECGMKAVQQQLIAALAGDDMAALRAAICAAARCLAVADDQDPCIPEVRCPSAGCLVARKPTMCLSETWHFPWMALQEADKRVNF